MFIFFINTPTPPNIFFSKNIKIKKLMRFSCTEVCIFFSLIFFFFFFFFCVNWGCENNLLSRKYQMNRDTCNF
ncbi:hypothetical protein DDB_G0292940 [Dictyostelium discoideum AX4]|uniref:Putative uncharacterized protein DDB_G0292940 n=1 Tax=Dictyostelium discoideum TaxID=44689 RepID=Y5530_DICDI|nr:hypothetical protein DDB_G0292940 [Dictyostelium discoideum AX4]Q54CM6.1 RecName: Full=Putative uncharacterized protein DDB_G0292940 [Dictyostelium discoideum]EAL61019.1 hypothetical protein DDB_G0292940 [Dictyostelium discoideum AX4]|eukprot:XP_629390.1 hypothetical protein DDB_G0292940 [Dictyostelium discoideum AX4]